MHLGVVSKQCFHLSTGFSPYENVETQQKPPIAAKPKPPTKPTNIADLDRVRTFGCSSCVNESTFLCVKQNKFYLELDKQPKVVVVVET